MFVLTLFFTLLPLKQVLHTFFWRMEKGPVLGKVMSWVEKIDCYLESVNSTSVLPYKPKCMNDNSVKGEKRRRDVLQAGKSGEVHRLL